MSQESEFDRLEQYVGKLLIQYDQLLDKNAQLQMLLQQREDEVRNLQQQVSAADSERGDISNRIKGLIDQIEEWQSAIGEPEEEPSAHAGEDAVAVPEEEESGADEEGEKAGTAFRTGDGLPISGAQERTTEHETGMQRNLFHVGSRVGENTGD